MNGGRGNGDQAVAGTRRWRGVQASRLKLTRAVNEARLATQAGLARATEIRPAHRARPDLVAVTEDDR